MAFTYQTIAPWHTQGELTYQSSSTASTSGAGFGYTEARGETRYLAESYAQEGNTYSQTGSTTVRATRNLSSLTAANTERSDYLSTAKRADNIIYSNTYFTEARITQTGLIGSSFSPGLHSTGGAGKLISIRVLGPPINPTTVDSLNSWWEIHIDPTHTLSSVLYNSYTAYYSPTATNPDEHHFSGNSSWGATTAGTNITLTNPTFSFTDGGSGTFASDALTFVDSVLKNFTFTCRSVESTTEKISCWSTTALPTFTGLTLTTSTQNIYRITTSDYVDAIPVTTSALYTYAGAASNIAQVISDVTWTNSHVRTTNIRGSIFTIRSNNYSNDLLLRVTKTTSDKTPIHELGVSTNIFTRTTPTIARTVLHYGSADVLNYQSTYNIATNYQLPIQNVVFHSIQTSTTFALPGIDYLPFPATMTTTGTTALSSWSLQNATLTILQTTTSSNATYGFSTVVNFQAPSYATTTQFTYQEHYTLLATRMIHVGGSSYSSVVHSTYTTSIKSETMNTVAGIIHGFLAGPVIGVVDAMQTSFSNIYATAAGGWVVTVIGGPVYTTQNSDINIYVEGPGTVPIYGGTPVSRHGLMHTNFDNTQMAGTAIALSPFTFSNTVYYEASTQVPTTKGTDSTNSTATRASTTLQVLSLITASTVPNYLSYNPYPFAQPGAIVTSNLTGTNTTNTLTATNLTNGVTGLLPTFSSISIIRTYTYASPYVDYISINPTSTSTSYASSFGEAQTFLFHISLNSVSATNSFYIFLRTSEDVNRSYSHDDRTYSWTSTTGTGDPTTLTSGKNLPTTSSFSTQFTLNLVGLTNNYSYTLASRAIYAERYVAWPYYSTSESIIINGTSTVTYTYTRTSPTAAVFGTEAIAPIAFVKGTGVPYAKENLLATVHAFLPVTSTITHIGGATNEGISYLRGPVGGPYASLPIESGIDFQALVVASVVSMHPPNCWFGTTKYPYFFNGA